MLFLYNSGEKKTPSKVKTIIISVAAVVTVVAAAIIIFFVSGLSKPANSSVAVYKTGGLTAVRIDNLETVVSDSTASGFKCDSENGRVFYTVESSYSDGLFDLYYIEKKRSEITAPKIIDIGISGDYSVVSGKLYYLKKNFGAGAFEGTVCNVANNEIKTFSGNVESIYALEKSDTVYFVKMHGSNRVLYKYDENTASEICRDLMNIRYYNDSDNPHIFYEKKSQIHNGMTELYILNSNGENEMICDNAYTVMYDNYSEGGNLYYFTSSSESISWSYVISDEYSESDKTVERPKRDDFFAFLGISSEYNKALKLYQDKLVRDEIRAALNESVENGEFSVPIFNAFAFNSQGTFKIAENIDPKNVYTVSSYGEPKIVFESTEILASDTDMGTLVEIAQRSTIAEVIKYARTVVSESVKSNGMAYAAYGSEGAVMYPLEGYDKTKTLFSFSRDGKRIFAFVRDTQGERLSLYTNSIGAELKPSGTTGIDTGISGYRFSDEGVIYLKSDIDKITGDVYSYSGEKSVKLSNAVNAFTVENFEDVIVLKNNDASSPKQTADYFICNDGEEKLIGSDVVVESFNYTEDGKAAYIASDGTLYIFGKEKAEPICENVSEILLFA